MKKNIFWLSLIFIVFMAINMTYSQTTVQVKDTSVEKTENGNFKLTVREGTETSYVLNFAEDINRYMFDNQDFKDLLEGRVVVKKNEHFLGIISSLLPVVMTSNTVEVTNFICDGGYVQMAGAPQLLIIEPSFSPLATLFLYLPLILVLLTFIPSWNSPKRLQITIFTILSSIAIAIGIISGLWLGPWSGLFVGIFVGLCVLLVTRIATDFFEHPFSAFLATAISSSMAGIYAGGLSRLELPGQEMIMLWDYLLLYIVACLTAIMIREIVIFSHNLAAKKQKKILADLSDYPE